MSIDRNEHPPTVAEPQRRGHMAALAVAEHIIAVSPIVPTGVTVTCAAFDADRPSVDVYFHDLPEGVQALAEVLGGTAETRPFRDDDPRVYTEASLVVSGVPVRIWALMDGVAAQDAAVSA